MKKIVDLTSPIILLLPLMSGSVFAGKLEFKAHVLFTEKSGTWAQTGVADIDKDGRLDFIAGNYGDIYWWQNPGQLSGQWTKHTIAIGTPSDVGGEAMDVDGDGWMDWVSSGFWTSDHLAPPVCVELAMQNDLVERAPMRRVRDQNLW